MSPPIYFVQECPTCGRSLQVRVEYLGRHVACQHCLGRFVAFDPSTSAIDSSESGTALLDRADKLLARAQRRRAAFS